MPPEPQAPAADDELDFDQSVAALLDNLPAPVRDYVTGKKADAAVLELTRKYQLRTDQAGELHKGLLMMLLGVYAPGRFVNILEDAGFSEETTEGIVADLNERVFAPLRKMEREATQRTPAPAAAPERAPLASVPAPLAPVMRPAEVVPPKPTAIATPRTNAPESVPPPPERAPVAAVPPPPVTPAEPVMRTMAHDVETFGEVPVPAPVAPSRAPVPPPMPQTPTAWSTPVPAPRTETPPPHPARAFGSPDPQEVTDTLKKYGIDPYREPPE